MIWLTRAGLFDSALDLELPELCVAQETSQSLFEELLLGAPTTGHAAASVPLSRMWQGYEIALAGYSVAYLATMVSFGVNGASRALVLAQAVARMRVASEDGEPMVMPPWLSDIDVLRSHRSNLVRRFPERYAEAWPRNPPLMPYLWPIVDDDGGYVLKLSKYDRGLLATGERALPKSILERIQ